MRVLLLSRYPRSFGLPKGGVESVTVILSKALARITTLDIHVITLEKGIQSDLTERDGEVTIHRLPSSSWPQLLDIQIGPGKKRLLSKIKQIEPNIVHSHETFGLCLGNLDIPHVFTVHGFDHANIPAEKRALSSIRSILWKHAEKLGLHQQKAIISISPYVKAMIEPLAPQASIYDIDNPVDDRYFSVKSYKTGGRVLVLGWINERKNTLGAVKAFAHALQQGCDGTLVIAGEAKKLAYKELLQQEISKAGIAKKVEFLGHINREQLESELQKTSILLLPSLQENAPMSISEAMAAGIPVVASNRCGMPFMVEEGESGFLVDPMDIAQIGGRLQKLLSSPELCSAMGKKGRKIAIDRFHSDVVAGKTLGVYEKTIMAHAKKND